MPNCHELCAGCQIEQPPDDREFVTVDGVMVKELYIAKKDTYIPQHSHQFDHTSALVRGSAFVWADGEEMGHFTAPAMIIIRKGVKHTFRSLEDHTVIFCIHKLRDDKIKVLSEHQFGGAS